MLPSSRISPLGTPEKLPKLEEIEQPPRPERCGAEALILSWRLDELRAAGYDDGDALLLAATDVDLHLALRLPRRGCPHKLALEILL
jgi:hypothetical protein